MQFIEGKGFHASLGRTGMKKRASFEIFVRQIRTTVRKWELCRYKGCPLNTGLTVIAISEFLYFLKFEAEL